MVAFELKLWSRGKVDAFQSEGPQFNINRRGKTNRFTEAETERLRNRQRFEKNRELCTHEYA